MPQKIILTEHQVDLIVNEIISEMFKDVDESTILSEGPVDEGLWTNVKYGLSKLGRYKAGGKIFGKGKVDQEAAAKIQAIVDKKGNEMIKQLDATIKKENPEFPNTKEPVNFLNTVLGISAVYDSIVAATQKDPKDETYMPIDVANGIINDLREYVKKFLDVDLAAVYSTVDEAEGNVIELSEEDLKKLDETWDPIDNDDTIDNEDIWNDDDPWDGRAGMSEDEIKELGRPSYTLANTETGEKETGIKDISAKTRDVLKAKRGTGADFDSERMKTLKSNKLPLMLAGIGSSLGAFSWLVNTEWFKHLFDQPYNYTDTETTTQLIQTKSEVLNDIKPGEGVYKLVGRVTNHHLDGNSNPKDFIESLKQIGGGDANKGVDLLCQKGGVMMKPDEAAKGLHDLVNNPDKYKTLNDMFHGGASGTGKLGPVNTTLYGTIAGRQLSTILVKMVPQIVTKVAVKTGIKTGAGYAVAKGWGAVLGPIGVGLLAAGALVKIMRMKGQKQSRAATLNDLYQSMRNLEGGTGIIKPDTEPVDPKKIDGGGKDDGGGKGTGGGKGSAFDDDLYNSLRNLFKFIVNNRKMLGTRSSDNVGTGGATLGGGKEKGNVSPTPETFKKGDKATYKGRNVTVTIPDVSPGYTQIDADGEGPEKKTYAVKTADLKKQLSEAKYVKDKRLIKFLEKNLSYDKLKSFEDFINRIEIIRNKVKKVNAGDDKAIKNFMMQFNSNPIMATDFVQLFSVNPDNAQAVNALKAFIDDLFVTVYSGKFKYGNMIDKMADLGGNINKLEEADKGYNAAAPNKAFMKDAQDRGRFKKNLLNFLVTAISLFQYLHKKRTENDKNEFRSGGGGKTEPKKPEPVTPPSSSGEESGSEEGGSEEETVSESIKTEKNTQLNEELNRIKNIMRQVI